MILILSSNTGTIQSHSDGQRSNGAAAEKKAAAACTHQVTNLVWSPNGRWLYTADDKGVELLR